MFRKRENEPIESEDTAPLESESPAGVESTSAAPAERAHAAVDEAEAKADEAPDVDLVPLELDKPSEVEEPSPDLTPSDSQPNHSDLPESEPLSAASKPAAANASPVASSTTPANKRLIVGQGIRLSGEINSCDRLVVEGEVEVTLNDTLALEITSSGRFTGGCEVEEADISGIYEGDLTVRNTLFVRGTGRITGTIRYGQLELERGGQIAGNISVLGNESGDAGDISKARSAKAPLFGSSAS